jgi:hypothetical protein
MRNILCALLAGGAIGVPLLADQVTIEPSKDNTIYEHDGRSNGQGMFLFAGRTGETENGVRRSLLAFDVAKAIPAASTILDVRVTLTVSRVSNESPVNFGLHRLLRDWGEGMSNATGEGGGGGDATIGDATWTRAFFPDTAWSVPGGDYVPAASALVPIAGLGTYSWTASSDLVADVRSWLDDPMRNFGWILIGNEVHERSARRFDSRENGSAETRPALTIVYTPGVGNLVGDFDGNGVLDAADLDVLTAQVLAGSDVSRFDLNSDQRVTDADRRVWIRDVRQTYVGDANLDGVFTSGDIVAVFAAGEYEDELTGNSTWATGDWNGDREFDTADFVSAFQDGGYEVGPRQGIAVPEPIGWVGAVASLVVFVRMGIRPCY